ncbi:tripartite tricarboxylate transporter permease, partial [Agrobacterium vitis]|nr:tripartite tricarboxylate transporter permease [Agrobacterium vitis]
LIRVGCEPAPLLLGFVLGPLLEEHLRRAMIISRGDATVFVTNPIAASLLGLGLVCVILALLPSIRSKRDQVFVEDD